MDEGAIGPRNVHTMTEPIKLSIITVCRNDAEALNRTIQNIAQQTYPDIELIIIDGQSTDHTHSIVNL